MTRRERVIAALNHKKTDFAPYQIFCDGSASERFEKAFGKGYDNDFGYHMHGWQFGWSFTDGLPEGFYKDECGTIFKSHAGTSVVHKPPIDDIENHNYVFPTLDENRLRKEIKAHLNSPDRQDKFTFIGGAMVYERASMLLGIENGLFAMAANPDELHQLYDGIWKYNERLMDVMLEFDFDGFYFGDDWGAQRGLIMGLSHWREFIKPVLAKMYKKAKDKGLYIIQHSCGNIYDLFSDLIEIGLDCYQTVQPECYDLKQIKKDFGDKLTFWGGISTQQLLTKASPKEVEAESRSILKILGKNGGYIFSPTHCVTGDTPPENFMALVNVMRNQHK